MRKVFPALAAVLAILASPLASAHVPGDCQVHLGALLDVSDRLAATLEEYTRRLNRDPDYPVTEIGRHHNAELNDIHAEQLGHFLDYINCAESR